jgi:hypothetical protein
VAVIALLGFSERDVGDPLAMHRQSPQTDDNVEEFADALGELVLVGKERHQHADRQYSSQYRAGSEENNDDAV